MTEYLRAASALARGRGALAEPLLTAAVPAMRQRVRPGVGRVRHGRPSSRPRPRSSSCCGCVAATATAMPLEMATAHAGRDGAGRHVRRARRRLRPLLGRRAAGWCRTSRRCSTTTRCWPRPTCTRWVVTGEPRYREVCERTLDFLLRELLLPERRLRLGARRRHRGRGGAHLRVDAGPDAGACSSPRRCRARHRLLRRHRARQLRGTRTCCGRPGRRPPNLESIRLRAAARRACSGRSRPATTRRSPAGTGSRWRRWPRPAGGWASPTTWMPRGAAPTFLLAAMTRRARAAAAERPRRRRPHPGLPRRPRRGRSGPARAVHRHRRAPLAGRGGAAGRRSSASGSPTPSRAGSSTRPPTASS